MCAVEPQKRVVKPYQLGNTVAKAVSHLRELIENGETITVENCGTVKSLEDIINIIGCMERLILSYRLEKWRKESSEKMGRPKGSVLDIYKKEIITLLSKGMSLDEVCDILGVKVSRVSKWLKRNGLSLNEIKKGIKK